MPRHTPLRAIYVVCCISIFLLAFLPFHGLQQTSQAHATSSYQVRIIPDVPYGKLPDEVMDECLPVGGPPIHPGIIMIHGGRWVGGDKSHYSDMCSQYADEGYVAVTINYRLAPNYQWPDQIGDVQLAVRYLRTYASILGLNSSMICALGDSAGAQLALMLDELQTIHPSDVASLYPDVSPAIQCVVDQFGPTDLAQLYNQVSYDQPVIYDLLDFQVPPAQIYTDASPLDNITAQTGAALIVQGTLDTSVPPDQSQELYQALQNDGLSAQYLSYDGGHEYEGVSPEQLNEIMAQINNFLNAFELTGVPRHSV